MALTQESSYSKVLFVRGPFSIISETGGKIPFS